MQTNRITVAAAGITGTTWAMSPFGNLVRC